MKEITKVVISIKHEYKVSTDKITNQIIEIYRIKTYKGYKNRNIKNESNLFKIYIYIYIHKQTNNLLSKITQLNRKKF